MPLIVAASGRRLALGIVRAVLGALLLVALALPLPAAAAVRTEVIVELDVPPLAGARGLAARGRALAIEAATRRLEARILAAVPGAEVSWRYRRVLAGFAVVLPAGGTRELERLPGVAAVYPSVRYEPLLSSTPGQIGAPALWGASLAGSAGRGMKIGIVDDGVDPSHPFFEPAGFELPAGFPKGDRRYTTAKVIVARAFPPPGLDWKNAGKPFDPVHSGHGVHVAGIAAGNAGTAAPAEGGRPSLELSGVAPLAYIGNYKALTVPSGVGLNGNSPEIVAAIEAAVEDGMDVVNLSLGQFEVTPERDAVAKALDNAAAAGVVPVVSAGNQFGEFGAGSVTSPATSAGAIAVAAVTGTRIFGVAAAVTGPGPVPPILQAFGGLPSADSLVAEPEPLVDVRALGADERLCDLGARSPLPPKALAGKLALVRRGGCDVATKIENVADAGGSGVVVADDGSSATLGFEAPFALPALFVSREIGDALGDFAAASPDGTVLLTAGRTPAEVEVAGGAAADFSAQGPTGMGLALKPDVAAPGVDVLSSSPGDGFELRSGTSMAAPHVAGAVALLLERHPGWSVEQVKSALVTTGRPVRRELGRAAEAPATREGGGLVDLPAADAPLLFASPVGLAFGLLDVSNGPSAVSLALELTDAGGGGSTWSASVVEQALGRGARVTAPASVEIPGVLTVTAEARTGAAEGDRTGFVVLRRNGVVRRVPFWLRVTRSRLDEEPARLLRESGSYSATTSGGPALIRRYVYPVDAGGARSSLPGPERAYRFRLPRPAANFGVAVISSEPGVEVEPRIVLGVDENRLAGPVALPIVANPYLARFLDHDPVAAVLLPSPGSYTIVFDSPSRGKAGRFAFRFWVDDVTPPRIGLLGRHGRRFTVRVTDAGSGVDPRGVLFALDGRDLEPASYDLRTGLATIDLTRARPGRHRLVVQASDRQEAKNTENVPGVLPNTRVLRVWVTVP